MDGVRGIPVCFSISFNEEHANETHVLFACVKAE